MPTRLRAAIVRELEDAGAVPPRVAVAPVASIACKAGPGAKVRLFRSR